MTYTGGNCPKCGQHDVIVPPPPASESDTRGEVTARDRWTLVYFSSKRNPEDYIINGRQTVDLIDELRAAKSQDEWTCNCRTGCTCIVSSVPHCHYCKKGMETK